MKLNNESMTLFIPLLGKSVMSKKNLFLKDTKAEEIISELKYDFNKLKQSKWLSMYMSLRSLIIDDICNDYISKYSDITVIHLGCGLDSRCLRVNQSFKYWYDIDYKEVIGIREKFYFKSDKYQMIGGSVIDYSWLDKIKVSENIMIVAEGLTMYLSENEIKDLILEINKRLGSVYLVFDAYSKKAVRLSKVKNPVKQMNAKVKYGIDNVNDFLNLNNNLEYLDIHLIRKDNNGLKGVKKLIFNNLYCGKISQSLYKIYEFKLNK